jgi:hypothetical protein
MPALRNTTLWRLPVQASHEASIEHDLSEREPSGTLGADVLELENLNIRH